MKNIYEYLTERQMGGSWKELEKDGYKVQMLVFEEPSQHGIDGGKISKLWIKKNRKVVCNYDRGWDIEPSGDDKNFYDELIKKYN